MLSPVRFRCSIAVKRGKEGNNNKNASVYKSTWGRGPKLGYESFTPPPAQRGGYFAPFRSLFRSPPVRHADRLGAPCRAQSP
eukprot:1283791-Prymnesium_polylepis.1